MVKIPNSNALAALTALVARIRVYKYSEIDLLLEEFVTDLLIVAQHLSVPLH